MGICIDFQMGRLLESCCEDSVPLGGQGVPLRERALRSGMADLQAGHSFTVGGCQHCLFRLSSFHPCLSLFPCFYRGPCPVKVWTHIGCPHCCGCSWSHLTPECGREGNGGGNSVHSPWGRLSWRSHSECRPHGPESPERGCR